MNDEVEFDRNAAAAVDAAVAKIPDAMTAALYLLNTFAKREADQRAARVRAESERDDVSRMAFEVAMGTRHISSVCDPPVRMCTRCERDRLRARQDELRQLAVQAQQNAAEEREARELADKTLASIMDSTVCQRQRKGGEEHPLGQGMVCIPCYQDAKAYGELRRTDTEWREALWVRHGCAGDVLYGEEGEMRCDACQIDFKRASMAEICEEIAIKIRYPRTEVVSDLPLGHAYASHDGRPWCARCGKPEADHGPIDQPKPELAAPEPRP